jgi:hypothetical protein
MPRLLKTFLFWLLIVVLPIQGMAAVANASCGTAHHETFSTIAGHDHSMVQGGHDGHEAMHAAMDGHHAPHAASHKHQDHKHSSCSACAACCFGAAAPPPFAVWNPAIPRSESVIAAHPIPRPGFVPPGIERPPRHLSA